MATVFSYFESSEFYTGYNVIHATEIHGERRTKDTFREGGLNGKGALSDERMSRQQGEKRHTV